MTRSTRSRSPFAELDRDLRPEAIVVGGGLSTPAMNCSTVCVHAFARLSFHQMPELRSAQLGDDAELLGAALPRASSHDPRVTPNPAVDMTWEVDRLIQGGVHRAEIGDRRRKQGNRRRRRRPTRRAVRPWPSRPPATRPAPSCAPISRPAPCRTCSSPSQPRPGAASPGWIAHSATPQSSTSTAPLRPVRSRAQFVGMVFDGGIRRSHRELWGASPGGARSPARSAHRRGRWAPRDRRYVRPRPAHRGGCRSRRAKTESCRASPRRPASPTRSTVRLRTAAARRRTVMLSLEAEADARRDRGSGGGHACPSPSREIPPGAGDAAVAAVATLLADGIRYTEAILRRATSFGGGRSSIRWRDISSRHPELADALIIEALPREYRACCSRSAEGLRMTLVSSPPNLIHDAAFPAATALARSTSSTSRRRRRWSPHPLRRAAGDSRALAELRRSITRCTGTDRAGDTGDHTPRRDPGRRAPRSCRDP